MLAREIPHKGGRTFGFRVSDGAGRTVAYLSDHCPHRARARARRPRARTTTAALELADGVDLLIHDAQYTAAELPARRDVRPPRRRLRGRRSAALPACGRVLLFHHDPSRTDDEVDALAAAVAARHPRCGSRPPSRAW